jgi:hypothetical protein
MNVERAKIVRQWHDIVVEHDLDAVLLPGFQGTAVPHDTYGVAVYTVLQNLLNVSGNPCWGARCVEHAGYGAGLGDVAGKGPVDELSWAAFASCPPFDASYTPAMGCW